MIRLITCVALDSFQGDVNISPSSLSPEDGDNGHVTGEHLLSFYFPLGTKLMTVFSLSHLIVSVHSHNVIISILQFQRKWKHKEVTHLASG